MQNGNGILNNSQLTDEEMIQYYMILNKRGVISDEEFVQKVSAISQKKKPQEDSQQAIARETSQHRIISSSDKIRPSSSDSDVFIPAKRNVGSDIFLIIIFVSIIIIICSIAAYNNSNSHSSSQQSSYSTSSTQTTYSTASASYPVITKDQAFSIAIEYVKDNLKAPSTAKFSYDYKDYVFKNDGATWIISGYVDAQNSFGAMLRSNFEVKFTTYREDGKDMVHYDYVNIH